MTGAGAGEVFYDTGQAHVTGLSMDSEGRLLLGGSITGGNVNGAAEANIYGDPEAAQIVFNAGWMVTMVGSDVGERTLITRKELARTKRRLTRLIREAAYPLPGDGWPSLPWPAF